MTSFKAIIVLGICFLFTSNLVSQELKRGHWKSYYKEGVEYLKKDSTEKALVPLEKAYNIAYKYYSDRDRYGKSLLALYEAALKLKSSQTIDSIGLIDEIIKYSKSLKLSDRIAFSQDIEHLARLSLNNNYVSNAINLFIEREEALNKAGDTLSTEYGLTLYGLGKSYMSSLKNNSKAKEKLQRALPIIENSPTEKLSKNDILIDLINVYLRLNDRAQADKTSDIILDNIKEEKGVEHKDYAQKLNKLGEVYLNNGILGKAAFFEKTAIEIYETLGDVESMDYLLANYLLGRIEKDNNNYEESIKAYKKVQKIFKENSWTELDNYAIVLGNIGLCYDRMGDYQKAIEYCNRALEVKGIQNNTKSIRLMDKGYFYENIGRFDEAHKFYDLALKSMELSHGKEHQEYAKLLNNIGKLFYEQGEFGEAEEYFLKALKAIEVKDGEKWHDFYSYMLNDYAKTIFQLGEVDKAEDLMKKNIAHYEKDSLPQDEDYYNRAHSLAKLYNSIGKFSEAKPIIDSATDSIKLILGSDHEDYGQFLKTKSETYLGLRQYDDAIRFLAQCNNAYLNQVDKIFRFSSEIEKKAFLEMISKHFNYLQSIAYTELNDNENLKELNLNNQLLLKGLLLNNSKGLLRDLKHLENKSVNDEIRYYKNQKNLLAKVLTEPISKRTVNVDSLKQIINTTESKLVRLHSQYFKESRSFLRSWKAIQSHLQPNEIAIEFSHFNIMNNGFSTDGVQYMAYIITPSSKIPDVIPLFKAHELKKVIEHRNVDEIYNSSEIYSLLWKPLEAKISKSKTIYFSPTGILNQISLAALTKNKQPIIHKYNLVQLSSTYNLIDFEENININTSLLIGGINYDYNEKITEEELASLSIKEKESHFSLNELRGSKSRGESWTYLEGTVSEIQDLNAIFTNSAISVSLLSDNKASEEAFKALDGNSPNLIHIATHGYFFENSSFKGRNQSKLSMEDQYRLAQDPLLRSGLILANANFTWKYSRIPKNKSEDGILTALEISNLDLSNTDLVVLSACETGLGDIEGSEGVYGLQRAFKMAGVDKLIMSLWEVPDFETSEFMRLFYKKWFKGQSINTAFIQTQREMTGKYSTQPSKWAAFVLFE